MILVIYIKYIDKNTIIHTAIPGFNQKSHKKIQGKKIDVEKLSKA